MIDWTARTNAILQKTPQAPTAKTAEREVMAVSAVPPEGVFENSQEGFGSFGSTPSGGFVENACSSDLMALFDACAAAGLYDDADRGALPAMYALDPDGTRLLIECMHEQITSCRRCQHFRRPGLSDGYCTGRDDLPGAYGLLRTLPDDKGATCDAVERSA